MESNPAVVQAEEAVDAAVAAFMAALAGRAPAVSGGVGGVDDDPLQRVVDGALDVLAGVARSEAKFAATKALAAAVLAETTKALNPPPASPHEATAQDRSLVAEVGCALAIGDRGAGALLAEAHAVTTSLPRSLTALQSGDDLLGARPDHGGADRLPRPRRGNCAGSPFPGPGRCEHWPRVPGRGNATDLDVPDDPGPSEGELPKDPCPDWHLRLSGSLSAR